MTQHNPESRSPISLTFLLSVFLAAGGAAQGQGYALELRGTAVSEGGTLTFPYHSIMNTRETATIEAWVMVRVAPRAEVVFFHRYQDSAEHKQLKLLSDGSIGFLYAGSPWGHGLVTAPGVFPFGADWHHVAFVRHADGRYAVFVDGASVLNSGPGPCWLTCNIIHAQTTTSVHAHDTGNSFLIDTLRVSTTDRYTGPFTPSRRWTADAATALLLQFDEGQGTTVNDEGPARQTGAITGDHRWVPIGALAGFATFGTGCPGTGGTPALDAASGSLPRLDTTFLVSITGLPRASAIAAIELGVSRTQFAGFTLPLELGLWHMPGCFLYQSRDITLGVLNSGGRASWSAVIPSDASLAGAQLHLQSWAADPAANALGVITSNGGTATLGF